MNDDAVPQEGMVRSGHTVEKAYDRLARRERTVRDHDVRSIRRPARPWVAPVPPAYLPNEDLLRQEVLLRIVDETMDAETLRANVQDLEPFARETICRILRRIGRPADAERVREAAPPPPQR